jgi:hypothetical protein
MTYTFYLFRQKRKTALTRKTAGLLLAIEAVGFLWTGIALLHDKYYFDSLLDKNAAGEGSYTQDLYVTSELYTGDVQLEVPEQQLTEAEAEEVLDAAVAEIDRSFLGDNPDYDHVTTDVVCDTKYSNGLVKATWEFSDYSVIDSDGTIRQEQVEQDTIVEAQVTLDYKDYERIDTFSFRILPEEASSTGGFLRRVQSFLDAQDPEEESLKLPDAIEGVSLHWEKAGDNQGVALSVLGMVALFAISYSGRLEEKRKKKERDAALQRDYPTIVSKLAMFLGVGVSLPEAVGRIAADYQKRQQSRGQIRPGYEMILKLQRELKDGVGEALALEHFANNCGLKEYRKLTLLLQQNRRKGNEDLILRLEREDMEAFELRKNMAVRAGEEASTRLLLPMMGMLAIVLVVIILPSFIRLQGTG